MNSLITYLIQSGISLSLLYIIYWLFMRKDTFFTINRIYLLLSAIFSFCLPLLNIQLPIRGEEVGYIYLLETITVTPQNIASIISSNLNIYQVISIIYLTGVTIFSVRFLIQLIQVGLLVKKYGMSKKDGINLVVTNPQLSPFSFFNLVFIGNNIIDNKQLEKIISHEQVHIQQQHSIDIILFELFTIIQWFNPFIWFYKSTIKNIHEFLADEGVLSGGYNKMDYQDLLLNQTLGLQLNELSNNFSQSLIKRRFTMMSKSKTQNFMLYKMAFILPVALFITFIFSTVITKHVTAQSDKATTEVKKASNDYIPQSQEENVFTVVEVMPVYPGGEEARIKFIQENIKYPKEALKNNISGTVFITFIIEKDGKITNVRALRGIGGGCDEEAIRVISMMPNWKPGTQRGQAVRVQFNMPIKFNLDTDLDKDNKSGTAPPPPGK